MTLPEDRLNALAEACEKASGPDRTLDCAIYDALFIKPGKWDTCYVAKCYTASLEAAMTLVPEGWWWTTGNCSVSADASVGPDVAHCDKETLVRFDDGIHADLPHPSTPAIALCVVSLRARALALKSGEGKDG